MRVLEIVQMAAVLLLAALAALMSQGAEARQQVRNFFIEALDPVIADLGTDPSYFSEGSSESIWPLPEAERGGGG